MGNADIAPRRLLRRSGAAKHVEETFGIPVSPKTLAKLAVVGGGPKFRKAGRIPLYDPPDLDEWARSKLSPLVSSTSELAVGCAMNRPTANRGELGTQPPLRSRARPRKTTPSTPIEAA
jgi:hypothetical protein